MNNEDVIKEQKHIFRVFLLVSLIIVLLSSFCFFIGFMNIPLGYILGTIFALLNHFLLIKYTEVLFLESYRAKKLTYLFYILRLLSFAIGFTICLLLDHFSINFFFWGSYLAAFMFFKIILVIIMKKNTKNIDK